MRKLIYALFVALFMMNAVPVGLKLMPRFVNYTTDLFAIVFALLVLLRLAIVQKAAIDRKYIFLISMYIITIVVGAVVNWVRPEPLIFGIRCHMKYLPFFMLPVFYEFSNEDVRKQIRFLLPLLFLQLPVVIIQKFIIYRNFHADFITGTIGVSSHLSMLLISSIGVLFSFYLKRWINLKQFIYIGLILFLPMTMNETKSTFVLLPMALALPAFFLPRVWASTKIKNLFTVGVVASMLLVVFAAVFQQTEGYGIIDHYEKEISGRGYLYTGSEGKLGQKEIGRADALLMALKEQTKDLGGLLFGLGAGNVIMPGSKSFMGDYAASKERYHGEMITVTHQLWELGILGVSLYFGILYCLFRDVRFLSNSSDICGVLALGWTGVLPIISTALIYKNIIYLDTLYVLFWYFSGILAAKAYRLRIVSMAYAESLRSSQSSCFLSPGGVLCSSAELRRSRP